MSKGRSQRTPQIVRVLAKAKLAEKARMRASALAARRARKVQADASPAPDPAPPAPDRLLAPASAPINS